MFKLPDLDTIYRDMTSSSRQMARGQVWCYQCGRTQKVDTTHCLRHGWPKCCGQTMSISNPREQPNR